MGENEGGGDDKIIFPSPLTLSPGGRGKAIHPRCKQRGILAVFYKGSRHGLEKAYERTDSTGVAAACY